MRSSTFLLTLALLPGPSPAPAAQNSPDQERRQELRTLLYQDCGSCHGMTLKGGLGPALPPQRMRALGTEALTQLILQGVPGTAMPAWAPLLTEAEARWLAGHLQQRQPAND